MRENKNAVIVAWRDMWHPQQGGAEVYITQVAHKLRDAGYNVTFITEKYSNSQNEETIEGIKYIRMGNAITLHIAFPRYYKKHLADKTDVLIENFNAVPFGIPKLNSNNLTVIHHVQEHEWIKVFGKLIGTFIANYFRKRLKKVYSNQKIVTVSPSSKQELVELGFKKKNIKIIYNGIKVPISNSIEKPKENINIISVGRIKNTKNIHEAIEMINHSVNKMGVRNIQLDIAGKGEDEERLKNLVNQYQLNDHVKFWGFVSEEKKLDLLKNAHLHVQFSRKEGWGITVIEAAATATPTICYRVPGLIDSVKDNTGYFVDKTLKESWQKVITDIKENNQRYKNKQEKCLLWADNFKWSKQMEYFLDYLEEKYS